jgi:hypothetical protein
MPSYARSLVCLAMPFFAVACGGVSLAERDNAPCEPDAATLRPDVNADADVDAGVSVDADATADAQDGPCALRIDALTPTTVPRGAEGMTILAIGCGFTGVTDVEVNVTSVEFGVIDDRHIVFKSWVPEFPLERPYKAYVDIIKHQPDQVQTFLIYE